jgi:hypothetical protein
MSEIDTLRPPVSRREVVAREDETGEAQFLHNRELRKRVQDIATSGHVEWVGALTLDIGPAFTTVSDDRVTPDCEISLQPLDAVAAAILPKLSVAVADLLPGTAYSANPVGSFIIRHPIVAGTCSYRYSIKG